VNSTNNRWTDPVPLICRRRILPQPVDTFTTEQSQQGRENRARERLWQKRRQGESGRHSAGADSRRTKAAVNKINKRPWQTMGRLKGCLEQGAPAREESGTGSVPGKSPTAPDIARALRNRKERRRRIPNNLDRGACDAAKPRRRIPVGTTGAQCHFSFKTRSPPGAPPVGRRGRHRYVRA